VDLFHALILGIVQGLTEFLPISSSAHLLIVPWLFGWTEESLTSVQFDVALHLGTVLAVLSYFAADWRRLIAAFFRSVAERRIGDDPDRRLVWLIGIASIPAGLVGVLFDEPREALFHDAGGVATAMTIIAIMMIVMGALLLLAERISNHTIDLTHIRAPQALGVGLAQALALIPGVSRSGATITAGLFFGLRRDTAARFSFLLSTPAVIGAGLKKAYDVMQAGGIPQDQIGGFIIGFVAAAISGFLCIAFLLRYLQRNTTAPFIWYRFMVGILLLVLVFIGFRA
jgi:undecaprenyl-diphosphatase